MRTQNVVFLALVALCCSSPAAAAPGDVVARLPIPSPCTFYLVGLAFDGTLLYYTLGGPPLLGTVFKIEARTGATRPGIVVTKDGSPVSVAGLEYDRNRDMLWGGGPRRLWLIPLDGGDVKKEIAISDPDPISVGYDWTRDNVWEGDGSNSITCWDGEGSVCGGMASRGNHGLTFDGVDMWHYTPDWLPPPAPNSSGFLVVTDIGGVIDYSRLIDPPGFTYRDLAYDCVTFPVPVVWVANGAACEAIAYEVQTRAPCLPPGDRLLRTWIPFPEPASAWLPPTTATARRIWQPLPPVIVRDVGVLDLAQALSPIYYYRLLGPGDTPRGNVLKATKDAVTFTVVLSN